MRGLMISAVKRNPSYHDPVFDRFWAALQEIGLPIAVHSGAEDDPLSFPRDLPLFFSLCNNKMFMMQRSLALLITSAVPQRFPKLHFVIVEGGIDRLAANPDWGVRLLERQRQHVYVPIKFDELTIEAWILLRPHRLHHCDILARSLRARSKQDYGKL
jgi:predicted TIM-barrel fold metal-dependent hydrolase